MSANCVVPVVSIRYTLKPDGMTVGVVHVMVVVPETPIVCIGNPKLRRLKWEVCFVITSVHLQVMLDSLRRRTNCLDLLADLEPLIGRSLCQKL